MVGRMKGTGARKIFGQAARMLVVLAAETGVSLAAERLGIGRESILMLFLLGVLFVTILTGSAVYGLAASALSVMVLNFFFTEPIHTFVVSSGADLVPLAFFLIAAAAAGAVMSRLQKQRALAEYNEQTARLLFELSGDFTHAAGIGTIARRGISFIRRHIGCPSEVELRGGESIREADEPPLPAGAVKTVPIPGVSGSLGSLRLLSGAEGMTPKQEMVLLSVASQMGAALEREFIYNERENIRIAMEREKLRSTLLRSVAHDLRSPLTALNGASSLLADSYGRLSDADRKKLAADISEEIVWLMNLVENILSMTRINEAQLILGKEEEVVDDVVSEALRHVSRLLRGRSFRVSLPDEVVTAPMDGRLVVQVIVNLLENAARHTPQGSAIGLRVDARPDEVVFEVSDEGEGIPPELRDTLFDAFVTLGQRVTDGKRGMGLGLAICRAVVEGHGGSIRAENREGGGAVFTFTLPRKEPREK